MGYKTQIQLIRQGDPVAPETDNPIFSDVIGNVNYLKALIDAAAIGSAAFARNVTVEPDALVGQPVYYNDVAQRFERSLALAEVDPDTQALIPADSSQVWGLVYAKTNSTLADLLIFGYAEVDLTDALADPVEAGNYYLSSSTPGMLVFDKPPLSIPVLRTTGDGKVFLLPTFLDSFDRHTHYKFSLTTQPAGDHTPPSPGNRHVIDNPDALLPGWLPADHSSFNGLAPAGASFGYNLVAHEALQTRWPPLPIGEAHLEWNKGLDKDIGGTGVIQGTQGLAIIDRNGIWWMSDCYGDVPWPRDLDTATPSSVSESVDECPRNLTMSLILWFSRPNFATETFSVTSLRSADDRVIVRCVDDTEAAVGDLEILLDFSFVVSPDETQRGAIVLKQLEDETFLSGPVLEGLYTTGSNVTLSSDRATVKLDLDDDDSPDVYQGMVQLEVSTQATQQLPIELVRVEGIEEEFFSDIPYLGMTADEQSSYRARIVVPADLSIANPQLAIRLLILGRTAGVLPDLNITARILPRPSDGIDAPEDLPLVGEEFAVTIDTNATLTSANQYVEATANPFAVSPGDIVLYTVERLSTDGYAGDVGILAQMGVITSA